MDKAQHILPWVVVILTIVLIAVIAAAVSIYRKNKHKKLTPDD
jgi:cbb3-type cytochrome oxidase subunit 3